MTRNTHNRTYDHHGTDTDNNILLSAATSSYASSENLHTVLSDIDARLRLASSSGVTLTIKDEGTTLDTAVRSINFVGPGVTATVAGHEITATISGGASTGGSADLITGDSSDFRSSLGSWVNSGGTLSRDTTTAYLFNGVENTGSLKFVTTDINQYVELSISGTFRSGVEYRALLAIQTEEAGGRYGVATNTTVQFGVIGTDYVSLNQGIIQIVPGAYYLSTVRWTPNADRTGVKLRLKREDTSASGTRTFHIGLAKAINTTFSGDAGLFLLVDPVHSSDGTGNYYGFNGGALALRPGPYDTTLGPSSTSLYAGGLTFQNNGSIYIQSVTGDAYLGARANTETYMHGGATVSSVGNLNDLGVNIEAGDDYVGINITEKDASTVQIYADWMDDVTFDSYDIELVDRGTRKWLAVDSGGTRYALTDALAIVSGGVGGPLDVTEMDGSPLVSPVNTLKFMNGLVTDNGGGVATISGTGLVVTEVDGSPRITNVSALKFANGTVTDEGNGVAKVTVSGVSTLTVQEGDGTPTITAVNTINFQNGTLTDNGGGVATYSGLSDVQVREIDGSPAIGNVRTIRFPNGSLIDEGSQVATFSGVINHRHSLANSDGGWDLDVANGTLRVPTASGNNIPYAEGFIGWDNDDDQLFIYDNQRLRTVTNVGWAPYAYPINFAPTAAFTTAVNLAASGGSAAIPILVGSHMLLQAVKIRNTDTTLARWWEWKLYRQQMNAGNSSENSLRDIPGASGFEQFTASAASTRTAAAAGAPVYLAPGVYWLLIRNFHTVNTFGIGTTAASSAFAPNSYQTKTLSTGLLASLDFVAVTWTKATATVAARLDGRVFGQTSAF